MAGGHLSPEKDVHSKAADAGPIDDGRPGKGSRLSVANPHYQIVEPPLQD